MSAMTYYSVLSSLDMQHGGLTTASLRRMRALSDAGRSAGILVANYSSNFFGIVDSTENGLLRDSVFARNMFYDIVSWPKLVIDASVYMPTDSVGFVPQLCTCTAGTVQVSRYYNARGQLVLSEASASGSGERRYTVFNPDDGSVLLNCSNWELRRRWIRWIDCQAPSVFFIDGVSMAQALGSLPLKRSLKYFMQHGPHSYVDGDGESRLHGSRVLPFKYATTFDRFVVQTERQRRSVSDFVGNRVPVSIISNVNDVKATGAIHDRRNVGIICTRFDEHQKRISDLFAVMVAVLRKCPSVQFEVYGDGVGQWSMDNLEAEVSAHGLGDRLRLYGFVPGASANYGRGLFTLMTSRYEGFPLNLVEASSLGCIPISYDIDYGPSDLIENGVNGFLVPDGDMNSMVDSVLRLAENPDLARGMRESAVVNSDRFSPRGIIEQIDFVVNSDLSTGVDPA